jgi:hypothetical protein
MTATPDTVKPPDHPLHQLTTFELSSYRHRLETALALTSTPPPRYGTACKPGSATCWPSRTTAPGSSMPDDQRPEIAQLTSGELDRYANQLTRCLKDLDTRARIRMSVQHELAEVRAEQDTRARTGQPAAFRDITTPQV